MQTHLLRQQRELRLNAARDPVRYKPVSTHSLGSQVAMAQFDRVRKNGLTEKPRRMTAIEAPQLPGRSRVAVEALSGYGPVSSAQPGA